MTALTKANPAKGELHWFEGISGALLHYQLPVVAVLVVLGATKAPWLYFLMAYLSLLTGLIWCERAGFMVRYFAWRESKAWPIRCLFWLLDRQALLVVGAVAGPVLLVATVARAVWTLIAALLGFVLQLLPTAFGYGVIVVVIAVVALAVGLPTALVSYAALAVGVAAALYVAWVVAVVVYRLTFFPGGLLSRLAWRMGAAFGGKGGVSAQDYSGIIAVLGTSGLLAAATWAAVDWSQADAIAANNGFTDFTSPDAGLVNFAADMPVMPADMGLVNFANGMPLMGDGSFIDIAGNAYGTDFTSGMGFDGGHDFSSPTFSDPSDPFA